MAKPGAGDRLAWKERIDGSSWVDNTGWLDDGPTRSDEPIEFLETEPSAYRLSESTRQQPSSIFASTGARLLGLGAIGVVLLAVALLAQPGDQDPFDQLPANKQQEILQRQNRENVVPQGSGDEPLRSTDTTLPQPVPTPSASSTPEAESGSVDPATELGPIPPLRSDLSPEMPGVLLAYGPSGSVIRIRRSDEQPEEVALDGRHQAGTMIYSLSDGLPLILVDSMLVAVLPEGGLESADVGAQELLPADEGIVLVNDGEPTREVIISSRLEDGDEPLTIGHDVDLLGGWRSRPLAHKAGTVWLLDDDGTAEQVSEGVLLGYDGRSLAMVRCARPDDCRIEVGPPDQPDLRSVPVPERLAGRSIDSWAEGAAVSPDGSRLAVIDRRTVSIPRWIDLDTGVESSLPASVNEDSPVTWSPDGRWLAYAFGDDIIVWETDAGRSWRVFIDRPISHLVWTEDAANG